MPLLSPHFAPRLASPRGLCNLSGCQDKGGVYQGEEVGEGRHLLTVDPSAGREGLR